MSDQLRVFLDTGRDYEHCLTYLAYVPRVGETLFLSYSSLLRDTPDLTEEARATYTALDGTKWRVNSVHTDYGVGAFGRTNTDVTLRVTKEPGHG